MARRAEAVSFTSERPGGAIELRGYLHLPETDGPHPAAIICHPHPSGGGSMEVPLVAAIASHLAASGSAALRFDFGGVGKSGGTFTDGLEEPTDICAAFGFLSAQPGMDGGAIGVAGWSFGSWMALTAVADGLPANALAAIAPPLIAYDWPAMAARLAKTGSSRCYIAGDDDEYCPFDILEEFAASISAVDADAVTILPGADHFLSGREREVASIVARRFNEHDL